MRLGGRSTPEKLSGVFKCLEKGGPVDYLLDVIAAFLDLNEIPDFGR